MIEVFLRLGVRVGVFRFVFFLDELVRVGFERERIYVVERMIFNVYYYIRENLDLEDRV